MQRTLAITFLLVVFIALFSFFSNKPAGPPGNTKQFYIEQLRQFQLQVELFQSIIATAKDGQLQNEFRNMRYAYKKIEAVVEYYFSFHAMKLNGPPVVFYEEDEPEYMQQQPEGMQVIEGFLFPALKAGNRAKVADYTRKLLLNIKDLEQTDESFAFSDEFIFDALMEECYRITAKGIAGFDSQVSGDRLREASATVNGIESILNFYKSLLTEQHATDANKLFAHLAGAQLYLLKYALLNQFNYAEFIKGFLDPIATEIGKFKRLNHFSNNPSPLYYSSIKKEGSMFSESAFNPDVFLDDNTTSSYKIELGKKLFFDPSLSSDHKRSCATCHQPGKAFTDGLSTSVQLDGHTALPRNAPTLWDVSLQRNLFFDSRSTSLEDQVMQVLNNAKEMHGSSDSAAGSIMREAGYQNLYLNAYPSTDKSLAAKNICNAIACYLRTLMSVNSAFDRYMRNEDSLFVSQVNGFNVFMGKGRCATCHFLPLFSGVAPPRYYYVESEVLGVPSSTKKILDPDIGRFAITRLPIHKYSFKTPTLRNIALTAPYMHNGVFKTLEETIDFYNKGGGKGLKIAPPNQTLPFDQLRLNKSEKNDLIAFLKTLTDTTSVY